MNKVLGILVKLLSESPSMVLQLLIHYGSRVKGRDIDLLAVYKKTPPVQNLIIGLLDIYSISEDHLINLVDQLDPIITEPLLTGELLYGREELFSEIKNNLSTRKPDTKAINYLFQNSLQSFENGNQYLNFNSAVQNLQLSLLNLSYAVTYFAFAHYYTETGSTAITLASLIPQLPTHLRDVLADINRLKKLQATLDSEDVYKILHDVESIIYNKA